MASSVLDPVLAVAWNAYRRWAATARDNKLKLDRWRIWSLRLAIVGAILATLSQQIVPLAPKDASAWWFKTPGLLGSAALAFAAYFGKQILNGDLERN